MKQIESQLTRLRLTGMNKGWKSIVETRRVQELSFTDGLQLLLQAEEEERSIKRFERLKTNARFRYQVDMTTNLTPLCRFILTTPCRYCLTTPLLLS
jgi:2-iminoacetate synthase ThiH